MIWIVLFISLILRLIRIDQSLWLDEAINVLAARQMDFWQFVSAYPVGDFHPPGFFAILWIWVSFFGSSEIAVRLPSVFFGVATVYLTYLIGKKIFNKNVGLVAGLLVGTNPLLIFYSQEARMYSLAAFAATLSFYFLIQLLSHKKHYFFLYALSVGFLLYSDYLAYLVIPAQVVYVYWKEKKDFFKFFWGLTIGSIPLLPWLMVFPLQLQSGRETAENVPGWAKVVGGGSIKNLGLVLAKTIVGRVTFENKLFYGGIISSICGLYLIIIRKLFINFEKKYWLLFFWVAIPTLLAFFISIFVPVLAYFRMIFIIPGLILLVSGGLDKFKSIQKKLLIGFFLAVNLVFLIMYYINPAFQREDWKGMVNFIQNQDNLNGMVIFEDVNVPSPFYYYFGESKKDKPTVPGLKNFPAKLEEDLVDFNTINIESWDVIYVVDYLVEISDPERLVDQKLKSLGWQISKTHNFNGVGFVYEYTRVN